MKFTLVAAALLGAAAAQESCLSVALQVPQCAQSCLESAAGKVGCSFTDFVCQCQEAKSNSISTLAETCVVKACGVQSALPVVASASAVCKCAGSGPASTSATASSMMSGSSMASSMMSGSSMSGSMMSGSMASSAMSMSTPMATGSSGSGSGSSGSGSSGGSSSIQTGAAPTAALGVFGGMAAGILGLVAAL